MVGDPDKNDNNFTPENYEDFYEHHHFEPLGEDIAFSADEAIPRFGWGYSVIEELGAKSVLDLGCLDGSFLLTLATNLGCKVTGVDLTKDGIDIAKKRAEAKGLEAEFYQGSVEDWLEKFIADGRKFDVVTFFEIIEHVEDPKAVLKQIDQVLAPGGSVLVSTPDYESPIYGADDEQNKCHIRLYTTADEDYERENSYGNVRKATSITKEIGKKRIVSIGVYNELINVHYK